MTDKTETIVLEGWMAEHALQAFQQSLQRIKQEDHFLPTIPDIVRELEPLDKWKRFDCVPVKTRVEIFIESDEDKAT